MFGHKTELLRNFWNWRETTSSNLSMNSDVVTTSISTASICAEQGECCSINLPVCLTLSVELVSLYFEVKMFDTFLWWICFFIVILLFLFYFTFWKSNELGTSPFNGLPLKVFDAFNLKSGLSTPLISDKEFKKQRDLRTHCLHMFLSTFDNGGYTCCCQTTVKMVIDN